jgi:acyl-coenzyme A synthetase/AMP-(fatty) acid ligase
MITSRIYEWARTQPTKTAMIHNGHPCSYAVFARAIEVTKTFFKDQSLPAGRTAIIRISNLADAWIANLGLRSIGLTTICVNSLATAKALNVKDVACIVLTEDDKAAYKPEERIWVGTRVIVVPRALYANIDTGDIPRFSCDTPAFGGHILYTSGTTGSYKKLLRDGANEEKRNAHRANVASYDRDTVYFVANFGLWTNQGFVVPSATWHVGGCVVFNQIPETFLRSFQYGITDAWFPPPMLNSLLELRQGSTVALGEFRLLVGGAFVSLDLAKKAVERLTKNVTVTYAATEHSSRMLSRFRTLDDLHWLSPVVGSTFEIVDDDDKECPIDKEGELRVLLRDIDATSYLDDDEASRNFFREGYFYPGDMAVRRADGRIRILGRVADVLNVNGHKVAVAPAEQRIQDFLGVNAVCLFSIFGDDGRNELVVAIEANSVPPKSELDKIGRQFSSFELVRFEVFQEFPRTEAGLRKIKRTELRKVIVGKGARAAAV